MKRSFERVGFALLVSSALLGCNKSNQFVGTWKTGNGGDAGTPSKANMMQRSIADIAIEFKSDNTFNLTSLGRSEQGTWTVDGSKATLTTTMFGTKLIGFATVSDDGKGLSLTPPGVTGAVLLTK